MSKTFNVNIISKYRNAIYGFAIFYITLFHAKAINQVDWSFGQEELKLFKTIMDNGNIGVDAFLFLSGISLYYSFHNNPDIAQYLKKRIRRLWLPLILVNGWYWLALYLQDHNESIFISRILTLRFWLTGDQSIWFLSLILVLYLTYPYIYSFIYRDNKNDRIILRTAFLMALTYLALVAAAKQNEELFMMTEIATTRIPVFILGAGCGKFIYNGKTVNSIWKIVPLLMLVCFVVEVHYNLIQSYPRRFVCLFGGVGLTYCMAFMFDFLARHGQRNSLITNLFSKLGEFSLEIYLSTITCNQILRKWDRYEMGTLPLYLVMLLVAYIFAYIVHRMENRILRKTEGR